MVERLPHGPTFRFVDEVVACEPGLSARGRYRVRAAHELEIMRDHFPGDPLLPGVIAIEMIAQLAGAVVEQMPGEQALEQLRLAAVRSAKIHGAARPGEELEIEVELVMRSGPLAQVRGCVRRADGQELAQAQVVLAGVEA